LLAAADAGTELAADRLLESTVTVAFDDDEPTRDSFDPSSGTSSTRTPTARRDCSIANSSSKGTLACTGPGSRGIESSG